MKLHFILFVVGVLFITAGYAKQMKPSCSKGVEVRFVPRTVYDEISQGKAFTESDYGLSGTPINQAYDLYDRKTEYKDYLKFKTRQDSEFERRQEEVERRQDIINEQTDV